MFDLLFSQVNHQELEYSLSGLKESFIQNLYDLIHEYENREFDLNDSQDIIVMATKLLGKMGHIPRTNPPPIEIELREKTPDEYFLQLVNNNDQKSELKHLDINFSEAINSIYVLIRNILEKKQNVSKLSYFDNAYKILKNSILKIYECDEEIFNENGINFEKIKAKKVEASLNLERNIINDKINNLKNQDNQYLGANVSGNINETTIEKNIFCLLNFLIFSNVHQNSYKLEIERILFCISKLVVINFAVSKLLKQEIQKYDNIYLFIKGIIQNMSYK